MNLTINKKIFDKFPELNVGIILVKGINNEGKDNNIIKLIREVEKLIRTNFTNVDIAKHELINPWRAAYQDFGAKPSKYHCSIEALLRRVLKGQDIPHINKLVDLYNYFSLKYIVPVGADDLDKVQGDITLTYAQGNEDFTELGSKETIKIKPGEVIYKDDKEVLCRRWNYRECDKTKITPETQNAIIYIEGLKPVEEEKLKLICEDMADTLQTFFDAKVKISIANKSNPEIKW